MSSTNLILGAHWGYEFPDSVAVCHYGENNFMRYVPERTCHRVWKKQKRRQRKATCSECGYGITDARFNYCPNCGARVVVDDADR